jgi:hypothetical protein
MISAGDVSFTPQQEQLLISKARESLIMHLQVLIRAMAALKVPFTTKEAMTCAKSLLEVGVNRLWKDELKDVIKALWNDKGIQHTFNLRGSKYRLDDDEIANHLFESIDRVISPDFKPNGIDMKMFCPNLKELIPDPVNNVSQNEANYSDEDLDFTRAFFYETIIATMKVLIRAAASLKQPIGTKQAMEYAQKIFMIPDDNMEWNEDVAHMIKVVWDDPGVKETYGKRGDAYTLEDPETIVYICENIYRFLDYNYIPSKEDVQKAILWTSNPEDVQETNNQNVVTNTNVQTAGQTNVVQNTQQNNIQSNNQYNVQNNMQNSMQTQNTQNIVNNQTSINQTNTQVQTNVQPGYGQTNIQTGGQQPINPNVQHNNQNVVNQSTQTNTQTQMNNPQQGAIEPPKFSDEDKATVKPVIQDTLFIELKAVVINAAHTRTPFGSQDSLNLARTLLSMPEENIKWTFDIQQLVEKLWSDTGIQNVYKVGASNYFLENFPRLSKVDFFPNDDDLLELDAYYNGEIPLPQESPETNQQVPQTTNPSTGVTNPNPNTGGMVTNPNPNTGGFNPNPNTGYNPNTNTNTGGNPNPSTGGFNPNPNTGGFNPNPNTGMVTNPNPVTTGNNVNMNPSTEVNRPHSQTVMVPDGNSVILTITIPLLTITKIIKTKLNDKVEDIINIVRNKPGVNLDNSIYVCWWKRNGQDPLLLDSAQLISFYPFNQKDQVIVLKPGEKPTDFKLEDFHTKNIATNMNITLPPEKPGKKGIANKLARKTMNMLNIDKKKKK